MRYALKPWVVCIPAADRAVWSSVQFFLMLRKSKDSKARKLGWLTAACCTASMYGRVRACRWWIAESDLPSHALPACLVSPFWLLVGRPSQSGPFLNYLFIRTRLCELVCTGVVFSTSFLIICHYICSFFIYTTFLLRWLLLTLAYQRLYILPPF